MELLKKSELSEEEVDIFKRAEEIAIIFGEDYVVQDNVAYLQELKKLDLIWMVKEVSLECVSPNFSLFVHLKKLKKDYSRMKHLCFMRFFLDFPFEIYWNDQISRVDIYNRFAYNSRQAMQNSTYLLVQV